MFEIAVIHSIANQCKVKLWTKHWPSPIDAVVFTTAVVFFLTVSRGRWWNDLLQKIWSMDHSLADVWKEAEIFQVVPVDLKFYKLFNFPETNLLPRPINQLVCIIPGSALYSGRESNARQLCSESLRSTWLMASFSVKRSVRQTFRLVRN